MFRRFAPILVIVVLVAAAHAGGDPVSGPKISETLAPFKVHVFTGLSAGEDIQLLTEPKDTPRVLVFVHELTRPVLQLLRPVDRFACDRAPDGLETHFIWLTDDKGKTRQYLENAKQSLNIFSPIAISLDGINGPEKYGLTDKAKVTILVAKGNKVVANFAFADPNETHARQVNAAIDKLVVKGK